VGGAGRPMRGTDAHAAGRHDADAALDVDPAGGSAQPSTGADRGGHRRADEFEESSTGLADPGASGLDERDASGLDEPDEDDPADEPPPQSVRPSDAVRVARMDAEVLVVDGRPRYHLGDCPHLAGRQTEPLPVNEAVELGFSPCGRCRPVDRLVARATHR
jgi:hypothetical protein